MESALSFASKIPKNCLIIEVPVEEKIVPPKDLVTLTRPYSFILKEGGDIQENYLDYSLLLIIGRPESIRPSTTVSCPKQHFAKGMTESLPQEVSP